MRTRFWIVGPVVALLASIVVGCTDNKGDSSKSAGSSARSSDSQANASSSGSEKSGSSHDKDVESDGWWCKEHGVPEHLCSQCMSAAEAQKQFKDKGDWCKEHDRAKSQCFICDPKRYDYYAKLYREKFKKDPPRPPDEEFGKGSASKGSDSASEKKSSSSNE